LFTFVPDEARSLFGLLQVKQSEHNYKKKKEVEIERLMAALGIAEEATRAAQNELAAIKDKLATTKSELAKKKGESAKEKIKSIIHSCAIQ
jgi:hypothetical protein